LDIETVTKTAVQKYSGNTPSLADLANLVNAVSRDIRYVRFYIRGDGCNGLRNLAKSYHSRLSKD